MARSVTALAALLLALALASCGWLGDKTDERKNWTAAEYYKAAKEQFDAGNWEAAAKIFTIATWHKSSSLVRCGRWERTRRMTSG